MVRTSYTNHFPCESQLHPLPVIKTCHLFEHGKGVTVLDPYCLISYFLLSIKMQNLFSQGIQKCNEAYIGPSGDKVKCCFSKMNLRGEKEQVLQSFFSSPKVIIKEHEERLDRLTVKKNAKTLPNNNYTENFDCISAYALIICGFKQKPVV